MEYFLGSVITLLCIFVLNKTIENKINTNILIPAFSQSRRYYILQDYLKYKKQNNKKTQSTNNKLKNSVRGVVVNSSIYWIEDGFLVTANFVNGRPEESSKKRVDTYNMNAVELKRIAFIVDKLAEGKSDDTGNTGNKNF